MPGSGSDEYGHNAGCIDCCCGDCDSGCDLGFAMTTKGGGRPTKSAKIEDNFNVKKKRGYVPTRADLLQAKLQQQIKSDQKSITAKEIESLQAQLAEMKKVIGIDDVSKSTPLESEDEMDTDGKKDVKQMLQDMRWVYREVKGRKKLKDLMADDKQFVNLAKELMRVETALLTAEIRTKQEGKSGNGRQSFFVVLKGLEEEKPLMNAMTSTSGVIDYKQISNAINPQSMTRYEAEEKKSAREKPSEIVKVVKTHNDEKREAVDPAVDPVVAKVTPITIQDVEGW